MANPQHGKPNPSKKEEGGIIRISGKDINGNFKIEKAVRQVKGIGANMANAIAFVADKKFGITRSTEIGSLSEEKIGNIENIIKEPTKFGIPAYILNGRRERETNSDLHFVGSDLTVKVKQDINEDIKMQAWRGYRHQYGQKVRGQRTKNTGRTGATIGVTKKAEVPGKPAAPAAKASTSAKK